MAFFLKFSKIMLYQANVLTSVFCHVIKFENSKFELFLKMTILDKILKPEMITADEVMNIKVS
jgi:hypothetical protein